jgi:amidophosphoribosyltransferase
MIAKSIGADSVNYLSMDGLRQAMNPNPDDYCYACMDGNYPIENRGEGMENRS